MWDFRLGEMVLWSARVSAVLISWAALVYLISVHASRIADGQSLGVFGVLTAIGGFIAGMVLYVLGLRVRSKFYQLVYWLPLLFAIALCGIYGITFAP